MLIALPAAVISFLFSAVPAYADLKLCNRMSYVVEVAIGIDDKAATATRGWFRIDPATCRVVAQGTLTADRILLNARALGVYGSSPVPQSGADTLCIAQENFVIAAARQCRSGQTPAPFTPIRPTQTDDGNWVAYLAEDSEYDDEQARLAGIQRLLVVAGYDPAPIDGVDGPKTQAALAAFLKNRGLTSDIVQSPNFFTTMIDAVQSPSSTGLTWCNDTAHRIMAAVATDDGKAVISRGWYRVDSGKCLHPDVTGQPRKTFSFAEAVDADNRTVKFRDKPLNAGEPRLLIIIFAIFGKIGNEIAVVGRRRLDLGKRRRRLAAAALAGCGDDEIIGCDAQRVTAALRNGRGAIHAKRTRVQHHAVRGQCSLHHHPTCGWIDAKPPAGCGGRLIVDADRDLDHVAHAVAEFQVGVSRCRWNEQADDCGGERKAGVTGGLPGAQASVRRPRKPGCARRW